MAVDLLEILLEHNAWATRAILKACRPLSADEFQRTFEIGPGSLHHTLRHIVGAMFRWADRIGGREVKPSIEKLPEVHTPDSLLRLLDEAHADLSKVVHSVSSEGRLGEMMAFREPGYREYTFTKAAAILHVGTHGMHHRAQAMNMLRRLGQPPLGMDLDVVEWECLKTGQLTHPLA